MTHKSGSALQSKLRDLLKQVVNFKDRLGGTQNMHGIFMPLSDGRKLSELFMKVPSKTAYADYYEVVKQPIDFSMMQVYHHSIEKFLALTPLSGQN